MVALDLAPAALALALAPSVLPQALPPDKHTHSHTHTHSNTAHTCRLCCRRTQMPRTVDAPGRWITPLGRVCDMPNAGLPIVSCLCSPLQHFRSIHQVRASTPHRTTVPQHQSASIARPQLETGETHLNCTSPPAKELPDKYSHAQ